MASMFCYIWTSLLPVLDPRLRTSWDRLFPNPCCHSTILLILTSSYDLIRSFIRSLNSSDTSGAYNSRTCPWDLVSCPTYPPMICRVARFTIGHRRVSIDGSTESQDKEVRGLPASSPSFLSFALLVQVAPSRISDTHHQCPRITVHILGKDVRGNYLPRQLMPLVFVHSSVERD